MGSDVGRNAGLQSAPPCGDDRWQVFGVEHIARGPLFEFSERSPEVLLHAPIDKFEFPIGEEREHETGNGVDNELEVSFGGLQQIFGPFAIFDISEQAIPAYDAIVRIANRTHASGKPSVDTVRASEAMRVSLGDNAGLDGVPQCGADSRNVIGVD
jgi:hypothetical protein